MPTSIHGHDVLALLDSPVQYTRDTLLSAIKLRFGEDAEYFTCSAKGMNAAELLELLDSKGKFHTADGFLVRTPGSSCGH